MVWRRCRWRRWSAGRASPGPDSSGHAPPNRCDPDSRFGRWYMMALVPVEAWKPWPAPEHRWFGARNPRWPTPANRRRAVRTSSWLLGGRESQRTEPRKLTGAPPRSRRRQLPRHGRRSRVRPGERRRCGRFSAAAGQARGLGTGIPVAAVRAGPGLHGLHDLLPAVLKHHVLQLDIAGAAPHIRAQRARGEKRDEVESKITRDAHVRVRRVRLAIRAEEGAGTDLRFLGFGAPDNHGGCGWMKVVLGGA